MSRRFSERAWADGYEIGDGHAGGGGRRRDRSTIDALPAVISVANRQDDD